MEDLGGIGGGQTITKMYSMQKLFSIKMLYTKQTPQDHKTIRSGYSSVK